MPYPFFSSLGPTHTRTKKDVDATGAGGAEAAQGKDDSSTNPSTNPPSGKHAAAGVEEKRGKIAFRLVQNDGRPENSERLVALKNIFAKQVQQGCGAERCGADSPMRLGHVCGPANCVHAASCSSSSFSSPSVSRAAAEDAQGVHRAPGLRPPPPRHRPLPGGPGELTSKRPNACCISFVTYTNLTNRAPHATP